MIVAITAEIAYHDSAVRKVDSLIDAVKKFHPDKIFSSHGSKFGNSSSFGKQAQELTLYGEKEAISFLCFQCDHVCDADAIINFIQWLGGELFS